MLRWMKQIVLDENLIVRKFFIQHFSGSCDTIFMLNWFTLCFIEHFILVQQNKNALQNNNNNNNKKHRSN